MAPTEHPAPRSTNALVRWWRAFDPWDRAIAAFMETIGIRLLRYSLAIVFIWFGALKIVDLSPATELVLQTTEWMPIPGATFVVILGWWEVLIGLFLLYRPTIRIALGLLFLQMPGTMLPLFTLPELTFTSFPFGLTLEGQYIIKNVTLISSALVVGGTARLRAKRDDSGRMI